MNRNERNDSPPGQDKSLLDLYYTARKMPENNVPSNNVCPSCIMLAKNRQRYTKFELLATGGVKQVFKVYDEHARRHVAMAMLRKDMNSEFYDPFIHEAWLTAMLSHPNIIKVHDIGIIDGVHPFFTMDLKKGDTLETLLKAGTTPLDDLLDVFIKICDALAYAHSQNVLHLDLKPSNVQVESFGEVLVCDWGLGYLLRTGKAHPLGLDPDVINNIDLRYTLKGTPGFMAPEQVDRQHEFSPQTDIFALGCILYAMLNGKKPFAGTAEQILEKTKTASIIPPSKKIPVGLSAIMLKALASDPEDRYASAIDLRQDILRYLSKRPPLAEKANLFKRALLFYSRNPVRCLIAATALIAITLLGNWSFKSHRLYVMEKEHAQQSDEAYLASTTELLNRYLKDTYFENPGRGTFYANRAVQDALKRIPDNNELRWRQMTILLIKLEFKAAKKLYQTNPVAFAYWKPFINELPSLHAEISHLPMPEQLVQIIKAMSGIDHERTELIDQMIAMGAFRRPSDAGYDRVVESALRYANPQWTNPVFNYQPDTQTLVLGGRRIHKLKSIPWHDHTLLHYLPIKTLKLEVTDGFNLGSISALPIEELDLSRSENLDLASLANFSQLKKVILTSSEQNRLDLPSHLEVEAVNTLKNQTL